MDSERRKNYRKLVRDPYAFGVDGGKLPPEDVTMMVRQCECEGNPNLDPNPGDCLVDEYTICGTAGIDDDVSLAEIPNYYIRVRSGPEPNPEVIFIPSFGEGGGCFSKGEQIPCSEAVGTVLGMDQYFPLPNSESDPACAKPPCVGPNCEWLRFTLCTNDPSYPDVDPFEIVLPVSFFGGFGLGYKVVKYLGHCYETPSIPCIAEPYEGATTPTFDQIEIISPNGCENAKCTCCDNVMERMNLFRDAIVERLLAVNFGNLPTGITDHDWDDPEYLLNADTVEVACVTEITGYDDTDPENPIPIEEEFCNDEETPCKDRYEIWRVWLVELDYWLNYLYATGVWLNLETYPTLTIEGLDMDDTIDTYDATDYEAILTEVPCLTWFRQAFSGPNAALELWTSSAVNCEGGLGTIDAIRFGDANPHVVVNTGSQTWCELMNDTVDRMIVAIQRLAILIFNATQADVSGRLTSDRDGVVVPAPASSCAAALACVQGNHPSTAFGTARTYVNCGVPSVGGDPGIEIGVWTSAADGGASRKDVLAKTTRGKIQANLIGVAAGVARVFIALARTFEDTANDTFGQSPRPVTGFEVWNEWELAAMPVASSTAKSIIVTGSESDPDTYPTCTSPDSSSVSWQVRKQKVLVEGEFII